MRRNTGPWHHVEVAGIARVYGKYSASSKDKAEPTKSLDGKPLLDAKSGGDVSMLDGNNAAGQTLTAGDPKAAVSQTLAKA
ncbi:hypothetical protein DPX39_020030500 [Trypanosoma brucei equiperdum]|uniref:Trypanosome variant surface glycoprotein (A-type) n=1 Tax=Trypanosoma brucei equiperdum TaxID=630700 RepID=A0A3L6LF95_9TRYP|nr:hypothetical protein DPX39_020030500 [Trypanosoma brucei equiperdum]